MADDFGVRINSLITKYSSASDDSAKEKAKQELLEALRGVATTKLAQDPSNFSSGKSGAPTLSDELVNKAIQDLARQNPVTSSFFPPDNTSSMSRGDNPPPPDDFMSIINRTFAKTQTTGFVPVFKAAITDERHEEFVQFAEEQAQLRGMTHGGEDDAYFIGHALGGINYAEARTTEGSAIEPQAVLRAAKELATNEQLMQTGLISYGNKQQAFGGTLEERAVKSIAKLAKSPSTKISDIHDLSNRLSTQAENPEQYSVPNLTEALLTAHTANERRKPFSEDIVRSIVESTNDPTSKVLQPIMLANKLEDDITRQSVQEGVIAARQEKLAAKDAEREAKRQEKEDAKDAEREAKRQEKEDAKKLTTVGAVREYAASNKPLNFENVQKYRSKNRDRITDLESLSPEDFAQAVNEQIANTALEGLDVDVRIPQGGFGPGISTNLRGSLATESMRLNRFTERSSRFKTYGEAHTFGQQLGLDQGSYGPIYEQQLEQEFQERITNNARLNAGQKTQLQSKIPDMISSMLADTNLYTATAISDIASGMFGETQADKNARMMVTNLGRPNMKGIQALLDKTGAESKIIPEYLKDQYQLRNGDLTKEEEPQLENFISDYMSGKEKGNFFEAGEDYLKYGPTKSGLAGIPRNFRSAVGKIGPFGAATFGWHIMSAVEKGAAPTVQGISQIPREAAVVGGSEAIGTGLGLAAGLATGNPIIGIVGSEFGGATGRMLGSYAESHTFDPEKYGQQQGYGAGSTDAVKAFADALRNTATPAIKELGETIGKASQQFGTTTKEGAGKQAEAFAKLQFGEGVQYEPIQAAFNSYLGKNPLLAQTGNVFSTQGLSKSDFENIASVAALQGDMSGVQAAMAQAQANRTVINANAGLFTGIANMGSAFDLLGAHSFDSELQSSASIEKSFGSEFEKIYKSKGGTTGTGIDTVEGWSNIGHAISAGFTQTLGLSYQPEADKKEQARQEKLSQDLQAQAISQTTSQGEYESATAKVSATQASIHQAILTGSGPEVYGNNQEQLASDTQNAIDSLTNAIEADKQTISTIQALPPSIQNSNTIAQAQQRMAESQGNILELKIALDENSKKSLTEPLTTAMAQLGQLTSASQLGATQATLGQGSIEGIYSANVKVVKSLESRAQKLVESSSNSIWTPEERANLLTQANTVRQQEAQTRYEARIQKAEYGVSIAGVGVTKAEMGAKVAGVRGTPEEIGQSISAIGPALAASLDNLSKQLAVASTLQKPEIERQIEQTKAAQTLIRYQAVQGQYGAQSSVTQSILGGQSAQLGWLLATQGTGKASDQAYATMLKAFEPTIKAATAMVKTFPEGTVQHQAAVEAIQELTVARERTQLQQAGWSPSAALSTQQIQWEGAATRMGFGFADKGNRNDIYQGVMSTYSTEEKQNTTKYNAWLKANPNAPSDLRDAIKYQYEQTEQGLLTSKAQAAYQLDTQFGQNIQTLLIGGSSSTARYMPSRAQLAMGLEAQLPGGAARVSGFYKSSSGDLATVGGQGYLAPGYSNASAQPGNWSLDALAKAVTQGVVVGLTNATLKLDPGNSSRPIPAKLANTSVYNSSVVSNTLPGTSQTQ